MRHGSTCKRKRSPRTLPVLRSFDTKLRPAAVLAVAGRGDYVLCQLTSNAYGDPDAVELTAGEFATGSLNLTSYARPAKLFTASGNLIHREVAVLSPAALSRIVEATVRLLRGN